MGEPETNRARDACGPVVMEVTSRAMAAEPGASSFHGVAVDAVDGVGDGDGHFWDACRDHADVRGRASIEQPRVLCRFNIATDMALQHALQQHRASTNPAIPPRI